MREATCGPGRGYLYRHMQRGACGRSRASLKGAIKSPVLIRHLQGCCQRPERTLSTERFLGSNGTDPAGASLDFEQNRVKHLPDPFRSEEHTSELQSLTKLVCRLLLEKKT